MEINPATTNDRSVDHHQLSAGQPSDRQLVAGCLAGEPQALTTLVERYQSDVVGTCLRLLHNREAALELANSIFYKAYRGLAGYDAERPLRPWLLRIATNEALNYRRARHDQAERLVQGAAGQRLTEQVPARDDPAAELLVSERQLMIRTVVTGLPEPYRLLIILRFFHELSYAEIAEQTGQSINTVGVQLLRARQLLHRQLSSQGDANADSSG